MLGGREVFESGGGRVGIEGFEDVCVLGVADWKSSKSSSSAVWSVPKLSTGLKMAFLPFEANSLGGVSGGISSSPNANKSTSGSLFLGGSAFFASRFAGVGKEDSAFRRTGDATAPSSYSSYSSKRSLLPPVSSNPPVFPPYPPPSP